MDTIASFCCVYEVVNHKVLIKLRIQTTSIGLIIYGTTRAWQIENLVTHGITDKAPYPSKAIALRCYFFPYWSFPYTINHAQIYNTRINSRDDAIRFKPASNHLWKWIDQKRIQCELRLMRI